jgi:hypothetical protein
VSNNINDSVYVANHFFSTVGFGNAMLEDSQTLPYLSVPDAQVVLPSVHTETDVYQRQLQYPGMAASMNDWAFQGVDAAFFDSLMRGTTDWDQPLQGDGA